jgi:hypothetical protein
MKASELNKLAKDAEMKRLLLEFTERMEDDPYRPGGVHTDLCTDDVQEIIEDVLFIRGHQEMVIRISRSDLDGYIDVEVLNRAK